MVALKSSLGITAPIHQLNRTGHLQAQMMFLTHHVLLIVNYTSPTQTEPNFPAPNHTTYTHYTVLA